MAGVEEDVPLQRDHAAGDGKAEAGRGPEPGVANGLRHCNILSGWKAEVGNRSLIDIERNSDIGRQLSAPALMGGQIDENLKRGKRQGGRKIYHRQAGAVPGTAPNP